jgi:hypothetical protein
LCQRILKLEVICEAIITDVSLTLQNARPSRQAPPPEGVGVQF